MYENSEKILEHHGVKGMHWGTRKAKNGQVRLNAGGVAAVIGTGLVASNATSFISAVLGVPTSLNLVLSGSAAIAGGGKTAQVLRDKGRQSLKSLPK